MLAYPLHAFFFQLLSEFVGHKAGRGHSQYNEGDLTVSLATARHVEVRQLGLGSQGVKFCSGDPRVFAHCVVDISKCLDGVPLTTEVLTYPVEALSPFSGPFCLRSLQLFDCLVVTLALFIEVRASQHGEQVVRLRECQGVHHGAINKHCYARHYFRISAGMSPCLISMSLVARAKATSTMTMPTSRGVKSSFGGLPPIAILPSRAYPAARPETTALWYSALTSILPSVAGVFMVLFHIVRSGQAFNSISWTLASGPAAIDAGLAR